VTKIKATPSDIYRWQEQEKYHVDKFFRVMIFKRLELQDYNEFIRKKESLPQLLGH